MWRGVGISASLAAVLIATGCGPATVSVDDPELSTEHAQACEDFLEALPDAVAGEARRPIEPESAPAAAYGDPAITITCGGQMPAGFDRFAACDEVDGVGWYVPPDQITDPSEGQAPDATLGTVGWSPVVALFVPADYRPEGLAASLSALAPAVKENLEQVRPCV